MSFFKKVYRSFVCRLQIVLLKFKEDDELYKYIICKKCKECIRLPKNKGKLIVTCPNCGQVAEIET